MSEKPLVSIILPVYNAILYIEAAILSITNQDYDNYELIIVDDGATDGSGELCQIYAKQNDKIRYIRQRNGGVCKARNRGIIEANGKYITFCDHDDEYAEGYLSYLVDCAEKKNLDMIKCSVHFIDISVENKIIKEYSEIFEEKEYTQTELIGVFPTLNTSYFDVWNGLYKTEVFRHSDIRFEEKYIYGMEDYDFNTRIIPYLNKIGFTSRILYTHYMRMNQSTSGLFKEERMFDISSYQKTSVSTLNQYNEFLPKGWKAALFGKNLIGIIKYSARGNISKKQTLKYLRAYTEDNLDSLQEVKFNSNYLTYIGIAYIAKLGRYEIIYDLWHYKENLRK